MFVCPFANMPDKLKSINSNKPDALFKVLVMLNSCSLCLRTTRLTWHNSIVAFLLSVSINSIMVRVHAFICNYSSLILFFLLYERMQFQPVSVQMFVLGALKTFNLEVLFKHQEYMFS